MTRDQEKRRAIAREHKATRLAFESEMFGCDAPRILTERQRFTRDLKAWRDSGRGAHVSAR